MDGLVFERQQVPLAETGIPGDIVERDALLARAYASATSFAIRRAEGSGQPGMTVTSMMPSSTIQARTISMAVSFFGMASPRPYVSAGRSGVINRATLSLA